MWQISAWAESWALHDCLGRGRALLLLRKARPLFRRMTSCCCFYQVRFYQLSPTFCRAVFALSHR